MKAWNLSQKIWRSLTVLPILFAFPASTTYQLKAYDFTEGGGSAGSSQYLLYGSLGGYDMSNQILGTTRGIEPGINNVLDASVPPAPTLSNPNNYYDKLVMVIDPTDNPTSGGDQVLFAVAISADSWVTTQYVKNDFTVGSSLALTDYLTYAAWGSGSGVTLTSLQSTTTYQVKATALHGQFTESGFGPASAGVATASPQLTFDVDISPTDIKTDPPFNLNIGVLTQNAVTTASDKIWLDLATNADGGASVYIKGLNGGLKSIAANTTIASAGVNLASGGVSQGFGLQNNSVTQATGGPMTSLSPFNGAADNVGALTTAYQGLFSSAGPLTGGRSSSVVKAKISDLTPAAKDYSETALLVAVPNF